MSPVCFRATPKSPNLKVEYVPPTGPDTAGARNSLVTPAYLALQRRGVVTTVRVDLPNRRYPAYRRGIAETQHDAHAYRPSIRFAKGLPKTWTIAKTGRCTMNRFTVPQPDQVVFKETFAGGEWFRSGKRDAESREGESYFTSDFGPRDVAGLQGKVPLLVD